MFDFYLFVSGVYMGCAFRGVVVPVGVQKVGDLRKFYEEYRDNLLEEYGSDFEGYSGDMAVDDGSLEVRKDIVLECSGELTQDLFDSECWGELLRVCEKNDVCKKWGPSVAVRVGGQWVICGSYSD